jgi:hypothetical protein
VVGNKLPSFVACAAALSAACTFQVDGTAWSGDKDLSAPVAADLAAIADLAIIDDLRPATDLVVGGLLDGSHRDIPATVDLTSEGTLDWVHWGLHNAGDVNRKMNNSDLITAVTTGASDFQMYTNSYGWTDGTPTLMEPGTHAGIYITNVGSAFTITVPAGTSTQTVKLYLTQYNSTAILRAHLSDTSAADYVDTESVALANRYYQYTLTFRAASAGQTLSIAWTLDKAGLPYGSVDLMAATLAD